MLSITVENYLKALYVEQQAQPSPDALVFVGRLAAAMGVVPGTATSMVKALAESGLVVYEPREGVRLSPDGEQAALRVLRRHRLVEQFLVQIVGLDWSEVHAEAEHLEHAISDKLLDRIDALLGHPPTDPHGDPIPKAFAPAGDAPATLGVTADPTQTLDDAALGTPLRIVRIADQDADFLQFARRSGLIPGAVVVAESRDPAAHTTLVRPAGGAVVALGSGAATKWLVEPAGAARTPSRPAPTNPEPADEVEEHPGLAAD